MSISITSSLPRTILLGFRDDSGTPVAFEEESLPIHLPWSPLFTEWGPSDDALLVGGNSFNSIYGSKSLDYTYPYATHQTAITNAVFSEANLSFIRRLKPADGKTARVRLGLDVVANQITTYERNSDGTYRRDNTGAKVPKADKIAGLTARWVAKAIEDVEGEDNFGKASQAEGELVSGTGATSTFYPIGDFEVRFFGKRGDNIGFRITAPTLLSSTPVDADLIAEQGAYLYRFWVVERDDALSTAQIKPTLDSEQYVDFSLKAGVMNRDTEKEYFADDVLLQSYEDSDPNSFSGYGRFGKIHFYYDQIAEVQKLIYDAEKDYGLITGTVTPEETINLFGATTPEGVPYFSVDLQGPQDGGLLFTESTNHFARGGADGTMTPAMFDQLVSEELTTFTDGEVPYMDSAVYPFSCFYDSGFSLATKKKMGNILARPDVYVVASTQDATEKLNTASEESSIAVALRAYFRSIPESDYYGTSTVRVVIMGHAGKLIGSKYKGILPFTVSLAKKSAAYMGSATGYMTDGNEFDSAPGSIVTDFKEHNATFKAAAARNKDWNNGLVFAQNYDRRSIFWPGLQTIYENNTSILNSFFNMVIACNLTRIGERAWRRFVGNSKLSNLQHVTRVDQYINEQAQGRYDSRVDVTPRSYYTKGDEQRGYSWHTDITMAGQGSKLVETLTIIAKRNEQESSDVAA